MTPHSKLLDELEMAVKVFSELEFAGLLVIARNDLHRRGCRDAALLVDAAARGFALEVIGPEHPSDNGASAHGDNGADTEPGPTP